MSLLDPAPIRVQSDAEAQYQAATRPTGLGEYLGAKLLGGGSESLVGRFWQLYSEPTPAYTIKDNGIAQLAPPGPGVLSEDEYKASTYWRDGLTWQGGMSPALAKARADAFDERRYRESLIARYTGSYTSYAAGFGAAVLGGSLSPENFLSFLGPGVRSAMVARLGTIGGHAAAGAADAAIGTALVDPIVFSDLNSRGENLGAADFALDMALGAVAGGVFGLGSGLLSRPQVMRDTARAVRIDGIQRQADALDLAMSALVREEPVDVGPVAGSDARLMERAAAADMAAEPAQRQPHAMPPEPALAEIASKRSKQEMERHLGAIDPTETTPYRELADVVAKDPAAYADIQAHGIAGADPEKRLAKLLVDGIDQSRDWHAGELGKSADGTVRAAGLGAKVEAPYVLISRHNEMKAKGFDAVVVNGEAKAAIDDLRKAFPGVEFLAPDEIAAWKDRPVPSPTPKAAPRKPDLAIERPSQPHPSAVEAEASVKRAASKNRVEEAKRLAEDMGVQVGVTNHKPEPRAGPVTPEKLEAEKLAAAKALAADIPEMQDIAVLRRDGLLTEADERHLSEADDLVKEADGWADAYNILSTCVLRFGA